MSVEDQIRVKLMSGLVEENFGHLGHFAYVSAQVIEERKLHNQSHCQDATLSNSDYYILEICLVRKLVLLYRQ